MHVSRGRLYPTVHPRRIIPQALVLQFAYVAEWPTSLNDLAAAGVAFSLANANAYTYYSPLHPQSVSLTHTQWPPISSFVLLKNA